MPPSSILILGGTREAGELASRLAGVDGLRVVLSLAGRTKSPAVPACETRIGGFGGAEGLARYIEAEAIDLIVDATHPFATKISFNAAEAADAAGVRRLALLRPEWIASPEDRWTMVGDIEAACEALPPMARVFLALGSQHIAAFSGRSDCRFVVRMVDVPSSPLPLRSHVVIAGRPASGVEDEERLLRSHDVTHVVCRNSGGDGASAKLAAARKIGVEVIMIRRPAAPRGPVFTSVDALAAAIF